MPQPSEWAQLDTARLLLALTVAIGHANYIFLTPLGFAAGFWQWAAWIAVLIFFVVSGLVISRSLRIRRDGFIPFMLRRVRRIYPPLLVCFALMLAIEALLQSASISTEPISGTTIEGFYFDLHRAALCLATFGFRGWLASDANVALWSLAIEMRCYVVAGLAGQLFQTRNRIVQAMAAAGLVYVLILLAHDRLDLQITTSYAAFAFGCVIGLTITRLPKVLPVVPIDISYSLYIFHFPIMLALFLAFYRPFLPTTTTAIALSGAAILTTSAVAWCSAKFIEPIRFPKIKFGQIGAAQEG
jgi:peptidoglycan/LPS O-acetylase OafA/YrhL